MKKTNLKKTYKKKKELIKGRITIIILLVVVIIGAVALVGGLFPTVEHIDLGRKVVIVDEEAARNESSRDSLQLRDIPFKECEETAAVDFLLDRTGSMRLTTPDGEQKIKKLKDAVNTFYDNLSQDSVIGVQSFADSAIYGGPSVDVIINLKKDITNFKTQINALPADGSTPTAQGLSLAYQELQKGIQKFPERQFSLIVVSDGQPCCEDQTFSRDPRNVSPDPSQQIKDLGVTIYSIGIMTQQQIADGEMEQLLKHIASSPENFKLSPDGEDLERIIAEISQDLCQSI